MRHSPSNFLLTFTNFNNDFLVVISCVKLRFEPCTRCGNTRLRLTQYPSDPNGHFPSQRHHELAKSCQCSCVLRTGQGYKLRLQLRRRRCRLQHPIVRLSLQRRTSTRTKRKAVEVYYAVVPYLHVTSLPASTAFNLTGNIFKRVKRKT
jgi:hypothetical protein